MSAFVAAMVIAFVASTAQADDFKIGSLEILAPWSRVTPKGTVVGVGYLKIVNKGTTLDRLLGGSSEAAESLEIHEMTMRKNVMTMRPVKGGLEIRPDETIELKPGSVHIMFVDLRKPLVKGDRITARLVFEKAGTVDVTFDVLALGATPDKPGATMGH